MTDLVERAKAALQDVTPGPWVWDSEGYMGCGQVYTEDEDLLCCNIAAPSGDLYPRSGYSPRDDMKFIAAARQLVPELVAEIERLRAGR